MREGVSCKNKDIDDLKQRSRFSQHRRCSLDIYRGSRRTICASSVIRPIRGPKRPKERSPGLNGTKIRVVGMVYSPKWARIQLRASTLIVVSISARD